MTKRLLIIYFIMFAAVIFASAVNAAHFNAYLGACENEGARARDCVLYVVGEDREYNRWICRTDASGRKKWQQDEPPSSLCKEGYRCVEREPRRTGHTECVRKGTVAEQASTGLSPEDIQEWTTKVFTSPDTDTITEQEPIILWLSSSLFLRPLPLPFPVLFTPSSDLNLGVDDTSETSPEQSDQPNDQPHVVIELKPRMAADGQVADGEAADGQGKIREDIFVKLERVGQDGAQEVSACGDSMQPVPERMAVLGGNISGNQLELMIKQDLFVFNRRNQVILETFQSLKSTLACYSPRTWEMALVDSKTGSVFASNAVIVTALRQAAEEAEEAEQQEQKQKREQEEKREREQKKEKTAADGAITVPLTVVPLVATQSEIQNPIVLLLGFVEELVEKLQARPTTIAVPILFSSQSVKITIPEKRETNSFVVEHISGQIFKFVWDCIEEVCRILGPVAMRISGLGKSEQLLPAGTYDVSMEDSNNTVATYTVNVPSAGATPTTRVATPVVTEVKDGVSQPSQTQTEVLPTR